MIKQLDWWYDRQMPRFLEQVVRAFSGFQYQTGRRVMADGTVIEPQLKMVPCTMAMTSDRSVAHIMRNNSENTTLATPRITVAHTGLSVRRQDLQHPGHVSSLHVQERQFDETTGRYEVGSPGLPSRSYTVDRLMPRPFEMTVQVDIWTSNQDQKYQLSEQILTVCVPDFAIQNSDNALDWSALTIMELNDINLTSRSVPVGTDSEIDVMTLTFRIPMWLTPPARVTQQRVIEQIVTNIHEGYRDEEIASENLMTQIITTPGNHLIEVSEGIIRLLGAKGDRLNEAGKPYDWKDLIGLYGRVAPTVSTIRLKHTRDQVDDPTRDIVGTIQYDTSNPNQLFWQLDPDTLPANTLDPIAGVIDPLRLAPGMGLPGQVNGQRYLITKDIGPSVAWGVLKAKENDIIEYTNGMWKVAFSPARFTETDPLEPTHKFDYVLNLRSGSQLCWNGDDWILTIDGQYLPGYWRLVL